MLVPLDHGQLFGHVEGEGVFLGGAAFFPVLGKSCVVDAFGEAVLFDALPNPVGELLSNLQESMKFASVDRLNGFIRNRPLADLDQLVHAERHRVLFVLFALTPKRSMRQSLAMQSRSKPSVMTDDLKIRIHTGDKDALRAAAAARGVPMAEHIRGLLKAGLYPRPVLRQIDEAIRNGRIALPLSEQLRRGGSE